jgi:hypothetical protein
MPALSPSSIFPLRLSAAWRCVLLLAVGALGLRAEVAKEDQVKAAFLYNFTKFVEWPAARFSDPTSPIVIGVPGRSPLATEVEKIVRDRTVNGRPIRVKSIGTAEDVPGVHLLFLPENEENRLPAAAWRDRAVMTVGESPRFTEQGGIITFIRQGDKLRFDINMTAAERGGLKISAQLQKLAASVRRRP